MFNQANKSAIFNRSFDVLLEVNSNKKIVKELENMDEKEILEFLKLIFDSTQNKV
jgi:hypothetical protein